MSRLLFSFIFVHLTCADQQCEGDGCSVIVNTLLQNGRRADAMLDGASATTIYRLDVSANNGDPYFWGIQELSFYDSAGDRVGTEAGTASAQTYYYYYDYDNSGKIMSNATYSASMAFNEVNDAYSYYKSDKKTTTGWLQYSFPESVYVASYEIKSPDESQGLLISPRAWILERSTDGGSTWTQLDEQSGQNWVAGETRQFTIKGACNQLIGDPSDGWAEGARCDGDPSDGWANFGKGLSQDECKDKCTDDDSCAYAVFNSANGACTKWSSCTQFLAATGDTPWSFSIFQKQT